MPTSYLNNIPHIVRIIRDIAPSSICDVGFGRGKYGLLAREYVDMSLHLIGVEVFGPYVTAMHHQLYDEIYQGNILEMDPPKADLYLLCDVIEHWSKKEAHKTLKKMLKHGKVLVVTPRADIPQGAVNGNDWEAHVSDWNGMDFQEYEFVGFSNDTSFIYLLCG